VLSTLFSAQIRNIAPYKLLWSKLVLSQNQNCSSPYLENRYVFQLQKSVKWCLVVLGSPWVIFNCLKYACKEISGKYCQTNFKEYFQISTIKVLLWLTCNVNLTYPQWNFFIPGACFRPIFSPAILKSYTIP